MLFLVCAIARIVRRVERSVILFIVYLSLLGLVLALWSIAMGVKLGYYAVWKTPLS